jgi:hypothetical protein
LKRIPTNFLVYDFSYFREICFEFTARRTTGFAFDEPETELGQHLKLPPWLESNRYKIEHLLNPVTVPECRPAGVSI